MKKMLVVIAVAIVAAVIAVAAGAFTQSGHTVYPGGSAFSGARVTILDGVTGVQGATNSDGNGVYTFGGLNSTHYYFLQASGCKVHSWYGAGPTQYNPSGALPTLTMLASGSC